MNSETKVYISRTTILQALLVFLWPWCVLWRFVVSVDGYYWPIVNDFVRLYYLYKVYLLDMLAHGHFPLWSPSEAGGYPFAANPFTQSYYPLNVLLLPFYKFLGGYSPLDHQRFTILGLSLFALGLFFWLSRLHFSRGAVLFASLIIPVSFKLTEILRFPNAVHAAAWYPWLLYFLTNTVLSRSRLGRWAAALGFFVAAVLLGTSGYPYYMYYFPFLATPYLCILLYPRSTEALKVRRAPAPCHSLLLLALASSTALLALSPYLSRMAAMLSATVDRGGSSFDFSTQHLFTPIDSVASLVYPPAALIEGWYYVGILPLLLVLLYLCHTLLLVGAERTRELWRLLPLVAIFGLISLLSFAEATPLFTLLWKHLPGFASLRVWARINIALVLVIALLCALAYQRFEQWIVAQQFGRSLALALACIGIVVSLQLYLSRDPSLLSSYWEQYAIHLKAYTHSSLRFSLLAGCVLLLTICLRLRAVSGWVLPLFVLVSVSDTYQVGPWVWAGKTPIAVPARRVLQIEDQMTRALTTPRFERTGLMPGPVFGLGLMENWYFSRYAGFRADPGADVSVVDTFLGKRDGQRLFVSATLDAPLNEIVVTDGSWGYFVRRYDGDVLDLQVRSARPAYLIFVDNWDPLWQVKVNEQPAPLEIAQGTFKAVRIPAGESRVVFSYDGAE